MIGIAIFCGLPLGEGQRTLNRIAQNRFMRIRPKLTRESGEHVYDRFRTSAVNVADRFSGNAFRKYLADDSANDYSGFFGQIKLAWRCLLTFIGRCDAKLESTWHERAQSDWHYHYEKNWG